MDPWPHSVDKGSGVAMSCGVGCGSDPALLWLWHRQVAAVPIQHLAWEPPYSVGAALKKKKERKERKEKRNTPATGGNQAEQGNQLESSGPSDN